MKGALPGSSTAQRPKPCSAKWRAIRSARSSLSAVVKVFGKYSITAGFALRERKASRSSIFQGRSQRREVLISEAGFMRTGTAGSCHTRRLAARNMPQRRHLNGTFFLTGLRCEGRATPGSSNQGGKKSDSRPSGAGTLLSIPRPGVLLHHLEKDHAAFGSGLARPAFGYFGQVPQVFLGILGEITCPAHA